MAKNLLIVRSPAKAKTSKILGDDFWGEELLWSYRGPGERWDELLISRITINPAILYPKKRRVSKRVKTLAKKADEVWLATDVKGTVKGKPSAGILCEVLDWIVYYKRIVFLEITKPAIKGRLIRAPYTGWTWSVQRSPPCTGQDHWVWTQPGIVA